MTRHEGSVRAAGKQTEKAFPSPNTRAAGLRIAILAFPYSSQSAMRLAEKMLAAIHAGGPEILFVGKRDFLSVLASHEGVTFVPLSIRMHYVSEIKPILLSKALWVVKCILSELEMARVILAHSRRIDTVFCTVGSYYHLPGLAAKLLGKELIVCSLGLEVNNARDNYGRFFAFVVEKFIRLLFRLADKIIIESRRLLEDPIFRQQIQKCRNGALFVEPEFSQTIPLKERRNLVGFIGRVSLEKGILPFVRAIPAVITALPDTEFMIIGSGRVDGLLQDELAALKLAEKVAWLRWVDRGEVGRRLNQLKLLVVPSSTEGLPYIILEAAACGTPVLATGVGGIPDLIAHGETGFLLPNNSSEAIARGIQSALSSDRLANIAEQARRMAEDEYSFQACVRRYRSIFLDRE